MEPTPAGPSTEPPADSRRPSVTQLVVVIAILALLVGGLGGVLLSRDSNSDSAAAGEVFLEPAGRVGPDPFTRSVAVRPPGSRPTTTSTSAGTSTNEIASVSGSTAGLYGGTLNATSCDRQQLATFLEARADKAAAWAAVQGIHPDEIRAYIETLTPVILSRDTRVTNHGFANGRATPRQSVLEAGTAVLVDRFGVPRARCACGNPLTPPTPVPAPTLVGSPWPVYEPSAVVVVVVHVEVEVFVLVDVTTGAEFERPVGTAGGADTVDGAPVEPGVEPQVGVDGDAGPGAGDVPGDADVPAPVATPSGTYTVEFSGEQISPPCSPWGAGTGSMLVTVTDTTVAITLSRDGGSSTAYAGTYDPVTGAFSAPDVQYGVTPLTGTFTKVDGVFEVGDGRSNGHSVSGGDCIGAFTAIQTVG